MRNFDELPFFEKFCAKYNVEYDYTTETPCMENLDMAAGYDVVDVITTVFDKPMLKKLHDLGIKCIATRTIGYDHIDMAAAKTLGFRACNASYSPYNVADFAVMLMLMLLRKAKVSVIRALVNDFSLDDLQGREMRSLTVGVVGTGKIGRIFADICKGFDMRVLNYDKFPNPASDLAYVDLPELLGQADVISLHCPLTDETRHMIDNAAIASMKPGVVIVDTSRGGLVDTEA